MLFLPFIFPSFLFFCDIFFYSCSKKGGASQIIYDNISKYNNTAHIYMYIYVYIYIRGGNIYIGCFNIYIYTGIFKHYNIIK